VLGEANITTLSMDTAVGNLCARETKLSHSLRGSHFHHDVGPN